ncbi:hypothetical protein [Streptomyces uncialis]|uniref:hypothetical protein n=1 Tax=Streptomyces uncialis TaxID=1048205 RepID=UPI00224DAAEE|nr:hypothetical protein [Streptomyces uncialis]MCX4659155.1 hypothetical protein [Streptomyces uncialis]WTE14061.1 hypothetical protein OG924_29850 [Streptomyces uncialis]
MNAIFVSLVGVLGTISGAALTAFVAARTERRRERSQDRVQLHELRVEHQRWRRERRQAAYLSFVEALGAADRDNQAFFRELRARHSPVPLDEVRIAAIRLKFKDAESAGLVVILEGPETIAEAAQNLVDQFASLVQDVREYAEASAAGTTGSRGDAVHEAGMGFIAERKTFLGLARDVLDEVVRHVQARDDSVR